ncbi:hypothetical protein [Erythrobacter sp.]|uniref:preprotein translocase subunit SecD n=1 Tax=Erythrobacter sp. TaxID=1042 RepID=UPI0025D7484A|nr:hypothetical protein [Erythrobacter sp.]
MLFVACLLFMASLFTAGPLLAEAAPTYQFVFEPDRDRLAKQIDGPVDFDTAMQSVIAVAKPRLNELEGSYTLTHEGEGRLVVQITHSDAPRIARVVFGIKADLDFLLIDFDTTPADIARGIARPGSAIYPMANGDPAIVVRLDGGISGDNLTGALAGIDADTDESVVWLQFDEEGKQAFADFTGANVGKSMAIVLDGEVLAAPTIQEAIRGGRVQISGSFTPDSANELAISLSSGALPIPLMLVEQRIISPTP